MNDDSIKDIAIRKLKLLDEASIEKVLMFIDDLEKGQEKDKTNLDADVSREKEEK